MRGSFLFIRVFISPHCALRRLVGTSAGVRSGALAKAFWDMMATSEYTLGIPILFRLTD